MMMRNKSDEAEMTFFFLSLLSVKEGMDFFFFGLVAELGSVGGKWGL